MATGRFAPSPTGDAPPGQPADGACWRGCSPGRQGAGSCSGSRTSTRRPARRSTRPASSPTWPRSASTGTVRWCGSRSGATRTRPRSPSWWSAGSPTRASAAAARSARPARRRTRRPASTRARAATSRAARGRRSGRPRVDRPRLRLRGGGEPVTIVDRLHGAVTRPADDIVLRRNDGVPAYHVAVVVDDDDQGVEEVVRADDLLDATPSQAHLLDLLGRPRPTWAHVPLVLGPDGQRLAKRHGAVTLADLAADGVDADEVRSRLAASLGLAEPGEPVTMAAARRPLRPGRAARGALDLPLSSDGTLRLVTPTGRTGRLGPGRAGQARRPSASRRVAALGDVARDLPGHERARRRPTRRRPAPAPRRARAVSSGRPPPRSIGRRR